MNMCMLNRLIRIISMLAINADVVIDQRDVGQ